MIATANGWIETCICQSDEKLLLNRDIWLNKLRWQGTMPGAQQQALRKVYEQALRELVPSLPEEVHPV